MSLDKKIIVIVPLEMKGMAYMGESPELVRRQKSKGKD